MPLVSDAPASSVADLPIVGVGVSLLSIEPTSSLSPKASALGGISEAGAAPEEACAAAGVVGKVGRMNTSPLAIYFVPNTTVGDATMTFVIESVEPVEPSTARLVGKTEGRRTVSILPYCPEEIIVVSRGDVVPVVPSGGCEMLVNTFVVPSCRTEGIIVELGANRPASAEAASLMKADPKSWLVGSGGIVSSVLSGGAKVWRLDTNPV